MNISRGTPSGIGKAVLIAVLILGIFYLVYRWSAPFPPKSEVAPAPLAPRG